MSDNTKKVSPKSNVTTKPTSKKKNLIAKMTNPVSEKLITLEDAYKAAISGKIKFGEVKSIFKQLHKEIKKSVKAKK